MALKFENETKAKVVLLHFVVMLRLGRSLMVEKGLPWMLMSMAATRALEKLKWVILENECLQSICLLEDIFQPSVFCARAPFESLRVLQGSEVFDEPH
mmetsp:Transcript_36996/g.72640  ORF Transcript_36996/g.72640 Transcript_36996/m.72640 type:complete len:98 (+) Transcript_36996:325-618(+)